MDTDFPTTILLLWDGFRQHFPARHWAYFQGDVWALAMLGTTRKCMPDIARSCVVVERHLASGERFLAEAHWDVRGVSRHLVHLRLPEWGSQVHRGGARLAAVDPTLIPKVRGQMPGVQKWHAHRGNPARGESWVGHPWARIGIVSAWGARYLCWPLLARRLPGQLHPLGCVAGADGVQRLDVWTVVIALVLELRQAVGHHAVRVVADADFSKASFRNPLTAEGIPVLSRLRQDAVGWDDPAPVLGKRPRGRPRTWGPAWKLARLLRLEPVTELTVVLYGQEEHVRVVWREVWVREVTGTVRSVALATPGEPLLLVSTDLTRPPAVMIQLYAARFPLELPLRELKQDGGLGD